MRKKWCALPAAGLLACFVSAAQDFEPTKAEPAKPEKKEAPKPKPVVPTAAVSFVANHDFYLTVNDRFYGKRTKAGNDPVRLAKGSYIVVFEEADSTGERLKQNFVVSAGMIKAKAAVHTVSFKSDLDEVLAQYTGKAAPPSTVKKTPVNETKPTAEAKEAAIAKELLAQMVLIAGGNFSLSSGDAQKDGTPVSVRIADLNVGKYEVTQKQWQDVMGNNHSGRKNCPACPVENVSYKEVQAFIEKLNKASAQKLRLPTAVEWEYIASKAIEKEVGFTTDPSEYEAYQQKWKAFLKRTTWSAETAKTPQPVGGKASVMGLYDLFGNVAEWCAGEASPAQTGGAKTAVNPAGEKRVAKGGSFRDKPEAFGFKGRINETPETTRANLGFRLVSDPH